MKYVARKVATVEAQACMFWRWFHCGDIISGWVDLHITSELHVSLLSKKIKNKNKSKTKTNQ